MKQTLQSSLRTALITAILPTLPATDVHPLCACRFVRNYVWCWGMPMSVQLKYGNTTALQIIRQQEVRTRYVRGIVVFMYRFQNEQSLPFGTGVQN